MVRGARFWPPFLGLPVAASFVASACGSSSSGASPADAGQDDVAIAVDHASPPPPPPVDASTGLDCATDLATDGLAKHLACAGLYTDLASKTVAAAARPYVPGLQLWADGATKQRWLMLPAGQKIDSSDIDEWVFPNGTKVWKEFQLDGKRIETRLYAKNDSGTWHHTSYRWNDGETDAVRADDGVTVPRASLDGGDAPPYQIPNGTECNDCHGSRKDRLLGLEPVSLALPGAQGITLASLVAEGLLTSPPPTTTAAFPEDSSGKAAAAMAWLHVSCGPCHNRSKDANAQNSNVRLLTYMSQLTGADAGVDGGPVAVNALDAYLTTVGKPTGISIPDGGAATFYLIKPNDPGASLVSYLSGHRSPANGTPNQKEQMPPIVTRLVDTAGHQRLDDWILTMP